MVRLLIARGADVNLGVPPIVMACIEIAKEECKKINVDMVGMWSRKYEVVQELLNNGANVHATHLETGHTALQFAMYNTMCNRPKLEALLREHMNAKRI